jgi:hypothetical protein
MSRTLDVGRLAHARDGQLTDDQLDAVAGGADDQYSQMPRGRLEGFYNARPSLRPGYKSDYNPNYIF